MSTRYDLVGVVVHAGMSPKSGHYYSYARGANQMWHEFDDENVTAVSNGINTWKFSPMGVVSIDSRMFVFEENLCHSSCMESTGSYDNNVHSRFVYRIAEVMFSEILVYKHCVHVVNQIFLVPGVERGCSRF